MKINVLDKTVYNRISAGEVVERPYSVVKELVENSIDSGAKNISVAICGGGTDSVEVVDDGCGIESGELQKAFLPHATSKICKAEDLDKIATLGFRGEALASIGAVSRVKLVSKPCDAENAFSLTCYGGEISEPHEDAGVNGTRILVENLFYNTPVRAKFLKSKRSEEGDITNIVSRLILANPYIAFKLSIDGKEIFQSYGDGLSEAMIAVYGKEAVENSFPIDTVKNGIGISGYLGKHNYFKANKTYQTLIVNGRYVLNVTVGSAVQNAYAPYLMKRQYPFYMLNLTLPSDAVDVNVHPNKLDIRFSDNQVVYGSVYSVVSKVLDGSGQALEIITSEEKSQPESEELQREIMSGSLQKSSRPSEVKPRKADKDSYKADEFIQHKTLINDYTADIFAEKPSKPVVDIFAENKAYIEELERQKKEQAEREAAMAKEALLKNKGGAQTDMGITLPLKYIGQVLNTYMIFECGEAVYIADQHALHERILYDKLVCDLSAQSLSTQPLLFPFELKLNGLEIKTLLEILPQLNELGIIIEEYGYNEYRVTEVPTELTDLDIQKFFESILGDNSLKKETREDIIKDKLVQTACKHAIKSGNKLSAPEIDELTRVLSGNIGLKCPHGRPVTIKITRSEMDKWFKRIV